MPFFCPWFSNARENKYSKRLADYKQLDMSINSVQFFSDLNTMKNQPETPVLSLLIYHTFGVYYLIFLMLSRARLPSMKLDHSVVHL